MELVKKNKIRNFGMEHKPKNGGRKFYPCSSMLVSALEDLLCSTIQDQESKCSSIMSKKAPQMIHYLPNRSLACTLSLMPVSVPTHCPQRKGEVRARPHMLPLVPVQRTTQPPFPLFLPLPPFKKQAAGQLHGVQKPSPPQQSALGSAERVNSQSLRDVRCCMRSCGNLWKRHVNDPDSASAHPQSVPRLVSTSVSAESPSSPQQSAP